MGKPVSLPRMIYVSPSKKGQLKDAYFGPLNPLASSDKKDVYIEEGIRLFKEQHS